MRTPHSHAPRGLGRFFLVLALLSALSLPIASSAHAAPAGGISLDGPCYRNLCLYEEGDRSLTAWSLWDVGPTPYYITVFNQTTGALLARCGAGTSCTTSRYIGAPLGRCYTYVAFIGGFGGSLPPNPVQRTSATFTRCNPLN